MLNGDSGKGSHGPYRVASEDGSDGAASPTPLEYSRPVSIPVSRNRGVSTNQAPFPVPSPLGCLPSPLCDVDSGAAPPSRRSSKGRSTSPVTQARPQPVVQRQRSEGAILQRPRGFYQRESNTAPTSPRMGRVDDDGYGSSSILFSSSLGRSRARKVVQAIRAVSRDEAVPSPSQSPVTLSRSTQRKLKILKRNQEKAERTRRKEKQMLREYLPKSDRRRDSSMLLATMRDTMLDRMLDAKSKGDQGYLTTRIGKKKGADSAAVTGSPLPGAVTKPLGTGTVDVDAVLRRSRQRSSMTRGSIRLVNGAESAFGVSLDSLLFGKNSVPLIVRTLVRFLMSRVSVPELMDTDIDMMSLNGARQMWDTEQILPLDPLVAGELLKLWFLMLPGSVMGLLKEDVEAAHMVDYVPYRVSALHSIVHCMPDVNKDTLEKLMSLLHRMHVSETCASDAVTLGAIFSPILELDESCITTMIVHFEHIFLHQHPQIEYGLREGRVLVRQACVDQLLLKLLDEYYRVVDPYYFDILLVTHQYFLDADTLLQKLCDMYLQHASELSGATSRILRMKVLKFLKLWLEEYLDPDWVSRRVSRGFWIPWLNKVFDESFQSCIDEQERGELSFFRHYRFNGASFVARLSAASFMGGTVPVAAKPGGSWLMGVDPRVIATQLCLVDQQLFVAIQPIECLGTSFIEESKAVNFMNMTRKFNQWSSWAASQICALEDPAERAEGICRVIRIARRCRKLSNYNSTYALLAGLNMTPVVRLRQTWKKVPKRLRDTKTRLDDLFSISGNYRKYKEELALAERDERKPPVVPYLGLYSKYLLAIDRGNATRVHGDRINFDKMRLIFHQARQMMLFQRRRYTFERVPQLYEFLVSEIPIASDDELYQRSLSVEPRESTS